MMGLITILLIILAVLILAEVFVVGWAIGFDKGFKLSDNSFDELVELNRKQNEMWYDFSGELLEMLQYDREGICPNCGADMRGK